MNASVLSSDIYSTILSENGIRDVEVGKVGDLFLVNLVEDYSYGATNNACGAALDFKIAFSKAISELIERRVRSKSFAKISSDGFAAFPKLNESCISSVRNAARSEAVERHCWAEWWDEGRDAEISFVPHSLLKGPGFSIFKEIEKEHEIEKVLLVKPKIDGFYDLQIYLLKLKGEGYLSGGACDQFSQKPEIFQRALIELYRHSIIYKRMKGKSFSELCPYEKRLCYFASGEGNELVRQRLSRKNNGHSIRVQKFEQDGLVEHKDEGSHYVYVAKFKNQRTFLCDDYTRFCI